MCGITGIVEFDGKTIDPAVLEAMTASLAHRGPDDGATHIFPQNEMKATAGLGHRRLSVIDLSPLGRQPMSNENGTVWIAFNGEVYNFMTIRQELETKGHKFRSNTDTEAIIHGYEEFGTGIFSRLNGMFAVGIWDNRTQTLVLARDRYGQKPLYFWRKDKTLLFASELKAFLKFPGFDRTLDLQALSRYLAYEYLPATHTLYKNASKLLPGHFMVVHEGEANTVQYWDITFPDDGALSGRAQKELEQELIRLLHASVERRLMSDVPLGVFLSGGIDSSVVVSLMAELMDPSRIKTFSIGFEEQSFDEAPYARAVAAHFGTHHHEKILSPQKTLDILPRIWEIMDEPFADSSILPTYLLSEFTRQTVTVALGGDGGDELLAGYDPFLAQVFARLYEKVPGVLHQWAFTPLAAALPVSHRNMSLDFRLKQFLKGMAYSFPTRNQVWLGSFSPPEQHLLLSSDVKKELEGFDPYDDIPRIHSNASFRDDIDELVYFYSKFYLAEDILTKVDRASMAVSLEVRSPFLDVELAEFINTLPSRVKLRGMTRKYLLKKAFANRVPHTVLARKKKGFGVPLSKWFRSDLRPLLEDTFAQGKIREDGLFDSQYLGTILQDHFDGRRDNRKPIWTLLMFQMWKERFG